MQHGIPIYKRDMIWDTDMIIIVRLYYIISELEYNNRIFFDFIFSWKISYRRLQLMELSRKNILILVNYSNFALLLFNYH